MNRSFSASHAAGLESGVQRRPRCPAVEQCGLTPPSSGHPKGRFAPFAPPLMSNVRASQSNAVRAVLQAVSGERAAREQRFTARFCGDRARRAKPAPSARVASHFSSFLARTRSGGANYSPCFRLRSEVRVSKEKHPLQAAAARPLGSGSVFKSRSTLTRRSSGRPKACSRTL